jgi:DNA (cytosine-5)-methyltransferase 1
MTCIDLFAGAGGLAEGFRQAGWRILSGADLDRSAAETFRHNFPEATFFQGDISALDAATLMADAGLRPGQLDCLIGGPPCQSFSYNNHARSADDERARLFRHYIRLVRALNPKTIVMENVPGILTIGAGSVVAEIRRRLRGLGYQTGIRILYAEDFGVPQERRRVFIIATRLGWVDWLFPKGTHGPAPKPLVDSSPNTHRWEPSRGRPPKPLTTVWDAISDLPLARNGGDGQVKPYRRAPMTGYQQDLRRGSEEVHNHRAHLLSPVQMRRIVEVPEGGNWRDIPRRLLPAGMKRALTKDHTKRYGRLSRSGLCCTILTKCDPHWGSYIHPTQNRTLTVREAARLQSFPDRFVFRGFFNDQYAQVGNAVPPAMAAAVARTIRRHLVRAIRLNVSRDPVWSGLPARDGAPQRRLAPAGTPKLGRLTSPPPAVLDRSVDRVDGSEEPSLSSTSGSPKVPRSKSGSRARSSRRETLPLAA